MPRKSRLVPSKKPISFVLTGLALIGKPFYLILSNLVIVLAFVLSLIGHAVNTFINGLIKAFHPPKKVKLSKPRAKLPNIGSFLKLESLRISLLELKFISRLRKLLVIRISRFQKLQLKKKVTLMLVVLGFVSSILYVYLSIFRDLPSPKQLSQREPEVSTKIYDRNGNLLYKIYKDENRTIVPLSNIPPHVRLATLAAEDAEFYNHPGFSVRGILRALATDAKNGSLQGGSTITQQLVKNALLTPEKTLTRKVKELILSIEVEAIYTKDQILEMYLNEVSFGGTAYGIEEAAGLYFGKDVKDLDLAEAAFLAGLPKSPTLFSPFGQNPDLALQRQKEVLHLMTVNKFITADQESEAENQTLKLVQNKTEIKAPHFVMYIRQMLVDKYGEDMVEKGGLEVTTSIDLPIQEATESIVRDEVTKLKGLNVGNGAALVLNPKTGEILAMVGSKDYFDIEGDGNVNVLTRLRQPGSSIKVVNYAYALTSGVYTPATIINDSPITYVTPGTSPYSPVNYDGQFRGNVSLRSSLAQSRNIPAVKVLASYGVEKMIEEGQKLGITTWSDPSAFGLSLTLGGGAVRAIDLAKVYATIANSGNRPDLMPILLVKDYKGRILEKNSPKSEEKVLDPRVAYSLIDILKDNPARAPELGFNSALVVRNHPEVAVKTGTSNDLRDNWTVGFNQNYLVLAWVGNNDNSPMSRIASGITGAAPIWNKIMSTVLNESPSIDWNVPSGMSKVNICTITGTLPCDNCPTRQEWFLDEYKPAKACTVDQIQRMTNPTPIPGGNILDNGAATSR
jgi:1A family penicillin-binding protein